MNQDENNLNEGVVFINRVHSPALNHVHAHCLHWMFVAPLRQQYCTVAAAMSTAHSRRRAAFARCSDVEIFVLRNVS
jgi:hypothetical protein